MGTGALAGASVELNGKGTGAGATASLLYTPLRNGDGKPLASIGLVYRTQAVVPLSGSLLVNGATIADGSTNLVLPQIYTGAIAIWPVRTSEREWKLELDVEYVGWKSNRDLDVHLSSGGVIPQPQNWKTVPVIAIGTEYRWLNPAWLPHWDVAVRSGYTRTEDPVPDRTFNPGTISLFPTRFPWEPDSCARARASFWDWYLAEERLRSGRKRLDWIWPFRNGFMNRARLPGI